MKLKPEVCSFQQVLAFHPDMTWELNTLHLIRTRAIQGKVSSVNYLCTSSALVALSLFDMRGQDTLGLPAA